jgi:polyhydroxyalkanoate synthesis regulator phasin
MLETVKNLMLASLGAVVITKEKAMQFMQQAVERGEMSAAEAEKVAEEVVAESKRQAEAWRGKFSEAAGSAVASLNLVKREELEALEERLAKVELELEALKRKAEQQGQSG